MAPTRETRLEAFAQLARIGARRGDDVTRLLHEACELAVAKLGLEKAPITRPLPPGAAGPVLPCGPDPPLEPAGGTVSRLADRPFFARAARELATVVVRGGGEDPLLEDGGTAVIAPMV